MNVLTTTGRALRLASGVYSQHVSRRSFGLTQYLSAEHVRIVEVGPRDGLQNEKNTIPLETKIELIRRLATTGLQTIEAGSFVRASNVPQMANSAEIFEYILTDPPHSVKPITYQWLLPNLKGLQNLFAVQDSIANEAKDAYPTPPASPSAVATPSMSMSSQDLNGVPISTSRMDAMFKGSQDDAVAASRPDSYADSGPALNTSVRNSNAPPSNFSGPDVMSRSSGGNLKRFESEASIFMAATETFSKKNTNCTIEESLKRFEPVFAESKARNINVRAYISVALGCPYEGPNVSPQKVADLATALLSMGAAEISVADTTGMGTAPRTARLLQALKAAGIRNEELAFHFHDTYGQALVNTAVAFEHGIRIFDSSVAGLGGCPFSPGATGNVATEDLLHFLTSIGAETGVDIRKVSEIGHWISQELGRNNASRAGKATLANMNHPLH